MQSTNEELETTKEELQSSNEELTTLNEELQNRNAELSQLANDVSNLLVGVNIPIAILDRDLRIRRFTPMAEKVMNLIATDVGRPFAHIASNLIANWDQLFSEVLDHLRTVEREVQDRQGHWYILRMRPYKTADNRIDGLLMALLDIDTRQAQPGTGPGGPRLCRSDRGDGTGASPGSGCRNARAELPTPAFTSTFQRAGKADAGPVGL